MTLIIKAGYFINKKPGEGKNEEAKGTTKKEWEEKGAYIKNRHDSEAQGRTHRSSKTPFSPMQSYIDRQGLLFGKMGAPRQEELLCR